METYIVRVEVAINAHTKERAEEIITDALKDGQIAGTVHSVTSRAQ